MKTEFQAKEDTIKFISPTILTCPVCQIDFTGQDVEFVPNNIFEKDICMYCDLEIGLEFQEGFGVTYTKMASKQSGLDYYEVKKRYLAQIINKIEKILSKSINEEERNHRLWNYSECNKQILAITAYQRSLLDQENKITICKAEFGVNKALGSTAFGIDLIRLSLNQIAD